jgi:hypothetical protein
MRNCKKEVPSKDGVSCIENLEEKMKTKIRETISGTEYWDSEEMKTISVPKDEKPDFDLKDDLENKEPDDLQNQNKESSDDDQDKIDLKSMTVEDLKKYAKDHDVEIPKDVKKKIDIIELLL